MANSILQASARFSCQNKLSPSETAQKGRIGTPGAEFQKRGSRSGIPGAGFQKRGSRSVVPGVGFQERGSSRDPIPAGFQRGSRTPAGAPRDNHLPAGRAYKRRRRRSKTHPNTHAKQTKSKTAKHCQTRTQCLVTRSGEQVAEAELRCQPSAEFSLLLSRRLLMP